MYVQFLVYVWVSVYFFPFLSKFLALMLVFTFPLFGKTSVFCVIHYLRSFVQPRKKEVEKEWGERQRQRQRKMEWEAHTQRVNPIKNLTTINLKLAPDIWTISYTFINRGISMNTELCCEIFHFQLFTNQDSADNRDIAIRIIYLYTIARYTFA